MKRDIVKLVQFLIDEVIPKDHPVIPGLHYVQRKAAYSAPEQMIRAWGALEDVLTTHLGPVDAAWKQRVSDIVEDRERNDVWLISKPEKCVPTEKTGSLSSVGKSGS